MAYSPGDLFGGVKKFNATCANSKERIGLGLIVPAFHGSTALEATFMSAPTVGTICSALTWQCEADKHRPCFYKHTCSDEVNTFSYQLPPFDQLSFLAQFLPLERKIFLLLKIGMEHELPLLNYINEGSLPPQMIKANINRIAPAIVIMWRPICLSVLSSHAAMVFSGNESSKIRWIEEDLHVLEDLALLHESIRESIPVLVLNYASLLWEPKLTRQRLLSFIPCIGKELSFSFLPVLGKDIFHENKYKPKGTIFQFGEKNDPIKCCGYDVLKQRCMPRENDPLPELQPTRSEHARENNQTIAHRMEAVMAYFRVFS